MAKRTVTFTVGGEPVEVSELDWYTIEEVVMPVLDQAKARKEAGIDISWWKARGEDIRILAAAIGRDFDELRRSLSMEEAADVSRKMNDLLAISGFTVPGEDQGQSGSTETSTGSSPS